MITDTLDGITARWVTPFHPVLAEAIAWARTVTPAHPDGIVELRGKEMFGNVHGYDTLPAEQCRWESHRHTADVQVCLSGGEVIDWILPDTLRPLGAYDPEKEVQFWQTEARPLGSLNLLPGHFAFFPPGEPHRPKVADGTHKSMRKVVVKIAAHLLA
ncbi:MAG: YhcH/YjgK/YiaL family protein [Verrucomicrobium sp.]|nr:YhcH/YjgK/YiaL family protein [Verrucomicrobium sp.]